MMVTPNDNTPTQDLAGSYEKITNHANKEVTRVWELFKNLLSFLGILVAILSVAAGILGAFVYGKSTNIETLIAVNSKELEENMANTRTDVDNFKTQMKEEMAKACTAVESFKIQIKEDVGVFRTQIDEYRQDALDAALKDLDRQLTEGPLSGRIKKLLETQLSDYIKNTYAAMMKVEPKVKEIDAQVKELDTRYADTLQKIEGVEKSALDVQSEFQKGLAKLSVSVCLTQALLGDYEAVVKLNKMAEKPSTGKETTEAGEEAWLAMNSINKEMVWVLGEDRDLALKLLRGKLTPEKALGELGGLESSIVKALVMYNVGAYGSPTYDHINPIIHHLKSEDNSYVCAVAGHALRALVRKDGADARVKALLVEAKELTPLPKKPWIDWWDRARMDWPQKSD